MADTATVAVLFCDLVASTERLSRLGDDVADEFRWRFFGALRTAIAANGGEEVKNLGDGLMVIFEQSTTAALACAADLHNSVIGLDPADPALLRVGISVGEAAREANDWFGTPVVEAARLCAAAEPGQTLTTGVVRALVGSRGGKRTYTDLGERLLKGLATPTTVVAVESEPSLPADARASSPQNTDVRQAGTSAETPQANARATENTSGRGPRGRAPLAIATALIAIGVLGLALAIRPDTKPSAEPERTSSTLTSPPEQAISKPIGYKPVFRIVDCAPSVSMASPDAACGTLEVPEIRLEPDGQSIKVDVVKAPASQKTTAPPVLLLDVNEGLADSPLREIADVYAVTLRGFGPSSSQRLACPQLPQQWLATLNTAPDQPSAIEAKAAAVLECGTNLRDNKVRLDGYTMLEVAADLRDLAYALKMDRVSISSDGYSTPAAVTFALMNPNAIESLMITNPIPPGRSSLANPALNLSKAFERIVGLCNQDLQCGTKFSDLATTFEQLVQDFDSTPRLVTTEPLGSVGNTVQVYLDGRRFSAALATAVQSSAQLGVIPTALSPGGVSDELLAAISINSDVQLFAGPTSTPAALLSYYCSYDWSFARTAELSDLALRQFAGATNPAFKQLCAAWDVPSVSTQLSRPLTGDLPVLLVEGGLSSSGVNGWADEMAKPLDNATVIKFETLSEDASFVQPACLRDIRKAFLLNPTRPVNALGCDNSTPPIEFVGAS